MLVIAGQVWQLFGNSRQSDSSSGVTASQH